MNLLNYDDYWNKSGSYATTGLTEEAKIMIDNARWYLGGISSTDYTSASGGLASHFYSKERGITVYEGNQTNWVGKVGLMYPSDYGYATSGGTTTNRNSCLAKEMFNWKDSSVSDCKNNDWLYISSAGQWVLTPYSDISAGAFNIFTTGNVGDGGVAVNRTFYAIRPCVYLSSDISISEASGTQSDPYQLSI